MTSDPNRSSRPFDTYPYFNRAYDFFNQKLFDGKLPPCLITFQRSRSAYAYFSGDRFVNVDDASEITDEIALSPKSFDGRPRIDVLATLVREMVNLWQKHFGRPSRGRYSNVQWARVMHDLGLEPSDTGKPGGRTTGDAVGHYIIPGGPFEVACQEFLGRERPLLYQDAAYSSRNSDVSASGEDDSDDEATRMRKRKAASKTRFSCLTTRLNAWAKPDANILCGCCKERMVPT